MNIKNILYPSVCVNACRSRIARPAVILGDERDIRFADAELQLAAVGGVVAERLVHAAAAPGDRLGIAAVEEVTGVLIVVGVNGRVVLLVDAGRGGGVEDEDVFKYDALAGISVRVGAVPLRARVTALFGGERYASEITVLSRARLQFIEEALLRQWMAEFPEVSMNYIRFLHQRIGFLNEKIRTFTESSVQKRVLGFLESHAPPGGEIRIPGGMAALARELNIGRTSLYRALEALEEKNKIYKKGQKWYREER